MVWGSRPALTPRTSASAAHWRVEHGNAVGGELPGEATRHEGIDGAHAGYDVAAPGALGDAALAHDNRLRLGRRLHHADGAIDGGGHALGGLHHGSAAGAPLSRLAGIDVVPHQREAVLDEIGGHGSAHGAETDESHRA